MSGGGASIRANARRVARLADDHRACPYALGCGEFCFGFGLAAEADGAAATAGERGQGCKSGLGAAELVDEGPESGGSDILAANQSQPCEPLAVVESRSLLGS